MIESPKRSLAKAISYRFLGSIVTGMIAFAVTRRLDVSALTGAADAVAKLVLFFVYERIWNKIHFGKSASSTAVVWITGLPASGKTTLAQGLREKLESRKLTVEHIDGDEVRSLFPNLGFDRPARDQHIRRVGHLASRLEAHGIWVIVSMVSPFRDSRDFARGLCKNFVEVHLSTPFEECARRDPKGLYQKAKEGSLLGLTGIQGTFEAPLAPELRMDTTTIAPREATDRVLSFLIGGPRTKTSSL
jgi:adenylylsulfate kinase